MEDFRPLFREPPNQQDIHIDWPKGSSNIIFEVYKPKVEQQIYSLIDEKVLIDLTRWNVTQESTLINPFILERQVESPILQIPILMLNRLCCMNFDSFMKRHNDLVENTESADHQIAYFDLVLGNWISYQRRNIQDKESMVNYLIKDAQRQIEAFTEIVFNEHARYIQFGGNNQTGPFGVFFERVFHTIEDAIMRPIMENDRLHIMIEAQMCNLYDRVVGNLTRIFHMNPNAIPPITNGRIEHGLRSEQYELV